MQNAISICPYGEVAISNSGSNKLLKIKSHCKKKWLDKIHQIASCMSAMYVLFLYKTRPLHHGELHNATDDFFLIFFY